MSAHELVIRGGSVVDGTGAQPRTADVAIDGGRVTAVGTVDGTGAREIDADGALVTPGWVDVHTHYDGQATWDTSLAPSTWHGVTTVVFGNCGVGFAPVHDVDHQRLIELMEGVEDLPGTVLHEGLAWNWNSLPEFLDALEGPHDCDIAAQVPHGALRLHVMGERGAQREEATPDDIAEMGRLAAEGIIAGFLGFTTSRTLNHRTSRGEPTPTLTASRDELVGIAEAIGTTGKGVLQMVGDFIDLDSEIETLRQMVQRSGRPLSFSLAQSPVVPDQYKRLLAELDRAQADGLAMKAQVAARAVGILLGLDCTLHPFLVNERFQAIKDDPFEAKLETMRDPAFRADVLAALSGAKAKGKLGGGLIGMFDRMFPMTDPPDYEPDQSASVAARAAAAGVTPEEWAYDHMATGQMFYVPFLNYAEFNLDAVGEMLAHPLTVPGLSDGGAHVSTICDASFPTYLLTHWVRDRATGRMPLAEVVKRQTRDTARLVGLDDRGVLAPGYRADVNVIDLDRLQIHAPKMQRDLPAGGRRVMQKADGYLHSIVAGTETYASGEPTGALPGNLIRGAQPAPT
jgi:N-acyl-D-aspartate/D-glutamate deacylase